MPTLRTLLAASLAAALALLTAGCERALFAVINRDVPPPDSSAVFAPQRGLSLDVYRPPRGAGPAPVVVFFYGGGWRRGQRAQYAFVGHRLAEQGMLAIVADYRTYPRAQFPDFVDDAALAVAWARAHAGENGGDPRRLYLAGHSAGAHIAALLATDPTYLGRVGRSPRDLAGVIGLAGPYDLVVSARYAPVFGPPAQWPRAKPVAFVDGDEPPFLLIHGDRDRRVDWRHSVTLAERLEQHRVTVRLLVLPGGNHDAPLMGLYRPRRQPAVLPAIVQFVATDRPPR